ncbi:MFS transporter [Bacillus sp. 1P06AnD]|uniref:MFS transporter n=1 Tax=Bacillus sp. 1P06AnD TaxID=3132208 RepID=UPI0039A11CEA
MGRLSKAFYALLMGETLSELAGAAGGLVNGLLLYEATGSREWIGIMWIVYYVPSLILQGMSSPFLNGARKEIVLPSIQLLRSFLYLFPLLAVIFEGTFSLIASLIIMQIMLGLLQPIYASLSFSILPDLCGEQHLVKANGLLDATIRVMSFIGPGLSAALLFVLPSESIYALSSLLFFISSCTLWTLSSRKPGRPSIWKRFSWWQEMKKGYALFLSERMLLHVTLLSSCVQFSVGMTIVLNIPFIMDVLSGVKWQYGIFSASFPLGYAMGLILLNKVKKARNSMYTGLIGGGLSFLLLSAVSSVPLSWICEWAGGLLFPLFNAQSAAAFQKYAPRDRLSQLSSIRLFFMRISTMAGILCASASNAFIDVRQGYVLAGLFVALPGIYYLYKNR